MQEAVDHLRGATPLVLYIFSQQKKFTSWIRENTASGAIVVNDLLLQFFVDALPFGGVGESGTGNNTTSGVSADCYGVFIRSRELSWKTVFRYLYPRTILPYQPLLVRLTR